ncbi:MAG: hypothetical protein JJU20_06540 [Opitutales bacterium]|nr:hypothetical protein [Opitutales bacterium]
MSGIEFSNPLPNPHGPSNNVSRPSGNKEASAAGKQKTVKPPPPSQASSWNAKLNELPEVRPEMVEKGKALIQNSDYPSRAQIEALASKLLGERDA